MIIGYKNVVGIGEFIKVIGFSIILLIASCSGDEQTHRDSEASGRSNDPAELTQNAIEKQRIGAYEEAIQELEGALKINPKYVLAMVRIGAIYEEWGKRDKALGAYKNVLKVDPKNVEARFGLASTYGKLVRNDLAVKELEKIAEDRNNDVNLMFKIAKEYWYLQDIARTIEFYQKTIKLDPNHLQAHLNLASVYEHSRDWNKAFKQIMISIELGKALKDSQAVSIAEGKLPFIQGRLNLTKEELDRKMQPPFE